MWYRCTQYTHLQRVILTLCKCCRNHPHKEMPSKVNYGSFFWSVRASMIPLPTASPKAKPSKNAPTDNPAFVASFFSSCCSDLDNRIVKTVSLGSSVFLRIFITKSPSSNFHISITPQIIHGLSQLIMLNCNYILTVITDFVNSNFVNLL